MLTIIKQRFLLFTCIVLSIGIILSCKKTTESSSQIQLLSFGPTGARHGDTLRFIGTNLDKVTTINLTGASIDKSAFIKQTTELILIIVPKETQQGLVTLKTPQGDIVSKTKLNLNAIVKVTTIPVMAKPGSNITVTGEHMDWVTRITFGKNKAVDSFVSKSINQIVVKVPLDAQTDKLIFSTTGTDPIDIVTDSTLKVTLPVITALSPNPVLHATNLTITGTDLDLAKKVIITGVSNPITTFVSQSATQLVITVPASTQKGKVMLEALSGVQTTSAMDLDVVLPAAVTLSPNPIDPGTNLTITGTNLNLVSSIAFQNAPAVTTFVSQTTTQIVVKVPMGVLKGKITLGVMNSTLTVLSNDVLDINGSVPPPTVTLPFYSDAITANWNGWLGGGWGGTKDLNNTSPVRDGLKSCRIDYSGGYGSPLQLGGGTVSLTPYTMFKISIYGAPGSGGKKINIGLNASDSYTITLVEGKWTDYSIPLSSMTSATTLTEIWIKEYSGTGSFTVYVDAMGLN